MDKESFIGAFNEWGKKYKDVLNERVHDKRLKRHTPPYVGTSAIDLIMDFLRYPKQVCQHEQWH